MSEVPCFWSEPSGEVQIELRRYVSSEKEKCPGPWSYHNISVVIGKKEKAIPEDRYESSEGIVAHDDHRWPKACSCGYVFQDTDPWQVNEHRLYAGGGKVFTLHDAPAGAMWDAWWFGESDKGPDGIHLMVQTPGGEWMPDRHSRNMDGTVGPKWNRTGTIPNISVTPSILIPGRYHGFLTNGVLRDC